MPIPAADCASSQLVSACPGDFVSSVTGAGDDRIYGPGGAPAAGGFVHVACGLWRTPFSARAAMSSALVRLRRRYWSVRRSPGSARRARASTRDAAKMILLCAGLLLVAGLLRLGFVAQFLSRPVVEGFVFALAIFVTVKQLPRLFPKPPLASGSHLVAR